MGKMGHLPYPAPTEEEFDDSVDNHEPFRLHRNRRNEQHDGGIGMHHTEGQQQAHHGTRCAHQEERKLPHEPRHAILHQGRPDTAGEVIDQEALRPQLIFERSAKHPEGEHIEEQMLQIGVQEHIGNILIGVEPRGSEREGTPLAYLRTNG